MRVAPAVSRNAGRAVVHIGISTRVAPLATRRNRIKRLIREALRRSIQVEPGKLYRLRIDKIPAGITYAQVENDLVGLFK